MPWLHCVIGYFTLVYTGKKRKRYGEYTGCMASDCGSCKFCYDKPKFGGKGKKKKSCISRKCINLHDGEGNPKQVTAPQRKLLSPRTGSSNIINRGKKCSFKDLICFTVLDIIIQWCLHLYR